MVYKFNYRMAFLFIHPYILYTIVFKSICVKCYMELFMARYTSHHLPRLFVSVRNALSRQVAAREVMV